MIEVDIKNIITQENDSTKNSSHLDQDTDIKKRFFKLQNGGWY